MSAISKMSLASKPPDFLYVRPFDGVPLQRPASKELPQGSKTPKLRYLLGSTSNSTHPGDSSDTHAKATSRLALARS